MLKRLNIFFFIVVSIIFLYTALFMGNKTFVAKSEIQKKEIEIASKIEQEKNDLKNETVLLPPVLSSEKESGLEKIVESPTISLKTEKQTETLSQTFPLYEEIYEELIQKANLTSREEIAVRDPLCKPFRLGHDLTWLKRNLSDLDEFIISEITRLKTETSLKMDLLANKYDSHEEMFEEINKYHKENFVEIYLSTGQNFRGDLKAIVIYT